jgi:hypothetical protein
MPRGIILDPTVTPQARLSPTSSEFSDLSGRVLGLRVDIMWRSWDWVTDEWASQLESLGADLRTWRAGARVGEEGERMARELASFVEQVDLAVVGLGN